MKLRYCGSSLADHLDAAGEFEFSGFRSHIQVHNQKTWPVRQPRVGLGFI